MKAKSKAILVCCLLFIASSTVWTQGYTWQWDAREPRLMPNRFIGIEVGSGVTSYSGALKYLEDLTGFECCTFDNGIGRPIRAYVTAEQWVTPFAAIMAQLGVTNFNSSFESAPQAIPFGDGREALSAYTFRNSIFYLSLAGGARLRLFESHLTLGAIIRAHFKVSNSFSLSDEVLGPDDYYFDTNPPSKVFTLIPTATLKDLSSVVLEPQIALSYDIQLPYPYVLQPYVAVSTQLNSISSSYSWTYFDVGAGIRFVMGIPR